MFGPQRGFLLGSLAGNRAVKGVCKLGRVELPGGEKIAA
jgi:hypothetical protein